MKRVSEAYVMRDTQSLAHKAIPELRAYGNGQLHSYWGLMESIFAKATIDEEG